MLIMHAQKHDINRIVPKYLLKIMHTVCIVLNVVKNGYFLNSANQLVLKYGDLTKCLKIPHITLKTEGHNERSWRIEYSHDLLQNSYT